MMNQLSIRELGYSDIHHVADYWCKSTPDFLEGMGVDVTKVPDSRQLKAMLEKQVQLPLEEKNSYCLIWFYKNVAVGHCNTNPSRFGEEGFLHLHMWNQINRKKGMGAEFLRMSLPYFFKEMQMKTLWSEPYAENPAPHRALEKCGFEFMKEYRTTPGSLSTEQNVKQWKLSVERFNHLHI